MIKELNKKYLKELVKKSKINQTNNKFEGNLIKDTNLPYRNNVCAIIIDENNRILLVRKHDMKTWQFVQGGVEFGESLEEALRRELKEEIGLTEFYIAGVSAHQNKYDWSDKLQIEKRFRGQIQTFFIIRVKNQIDIILQKEELAEYRWATIDNVPALLVYEDIVESFNKIKKELL